MLDPTDFGGSRLSRTASDDRHGPNQGQTCRRAVADQDRARDGNLARNRLQGQGQGQGWREWHGRPRSVGSPGRPRPVGVTNTAICSLCVLQDAHRCSFGPFRPSTQRVSALPKAQSLERPNTAHTCLCVAILIPFLLCKTEIDMLNLECYTSCATLEESP